jgi:hypothetical protein
MKEDQFHHLEDDTHSVKLAFDQLSKIDPDAFYTENQVLICGGVQHNDFFYVTDIRHPPLFFRKNQAFRTIDNDHFGAYSKINSKGAEAFLEPVD